MKVRPNLSKIRGQKLQIVIIQKLFTLNKKVRRIKKCLWKKITKNKKVGIWDRLHWIRYESLPRNVHVRTRKGREELWAWKQQLQ